MTTGKLQACSLPILQEGLDSHPIKRNVASLREKARIWMQQHRAEAKKSKEATKFANEQHCKHDADYREYEHKIGKNQHFPGLIFVYQMSETAVVFGFVPSQKPPKWDQ
ncbi:hypothetical protein B0H14DRAFT_2635767 [Mycena olivaceomarginata]|nr:hypothetical protein B0H14DRAFT_2635767 [Mycena olivaceomarginata]